jgi:hypothetical protein
MKRRNELIFAAAMVGLAAFSWNAGGLSARYKSSAQTMNSAQVARFEINAGTESNGESRPLSFVMVPDTVNTCTVVLTNTGEVAADVYMSVETLQSVFPDLSITMDNASVEEDGRFAAKGLAPGESRSCKLQIVWNAGEDALEYAGMVDAFALTVTAEQVD